MTVSEFAVAVWTYSTSTNAYVTSWIRSKVHNAEVGGVPGSPHIYGVGLDVRYDNPWPTIERRQKLATQLGLKLIPEGDHDHLQPIGWINKP